MLEIYPLLVNIGSFLVCLCFFFVCLIFGGLFLEQLLEMGLGSFVVRS